MEVKQSLFKSDQTDLAKHSSVRDFSSSDKSSRTQTWMGSKFRTCWRTAPPLQSHRGRTGATTFFGAFFFFFCNAKRGSSLFFASLPLATRVLKAARRSTNKIQSKVVGRETGWLRLTCEESTTLARLRVAREAKTNAPRRRFSFPLRTRADARDQKRNVGDAKARRPTVKTKALLYL